MKNLKVLFAAVILVFTIVCISTSYVFAGNEAVKIGLKEGSIKLYPPFEVTSAGLYKDGGTIAIVVEDGRGVSFPFCLDGRIKVPQYERYVYVGATYPTNSKAKQIPMGGKDEKAILKILKSAKFRESRMVRGDLIKTVIERLQSR